MSICDNSLLISFNSRIQIRVHFIRFEHCQVSICENSFAKTFIFGFLELFYFSFLYRFIVMKCPEAKCRFVKPLQHFLLNLRSPDVSFQACSSILFFIFKHHQHRVAIGSLDLSQYQFVTTVHWISSFLIFAGGICGAADSIFIDADDDHARWWVALRSDRSLGRATFHCVLQ